MVWRGANKESFCCLRPFWNVVSQLVREDVDAFVDINFAHSMYRRNQSVSDIMKAMHNNTKLPGDTYSSLI